MSGFSISRRVGLDEVSVAILGGHPGTEPFAFDWRQQMQSASEPVSLAWPGHGDPYHDDADYPFGLALSVGVDRNPACRPLTSKL
jgi:hypothetical protein